MGFFLYFTPGAGSGPPPSSDILLEGFENNPSVGGPAWSTCQAQDLAGQPVTATRTTSHVTQGTYSWRLQGSVNGIPALGSDSADISGTLTSSQTFRIDVYVDTLHAEDWVMFLVSDGNVQETMLSQKGQTGAFTLICPTDRFDPAYDNVNWAVYALGNPTSFEGLHGPCDIYVDNLRAVTTDDSPDMVNGELISTPGIQGRRVPAGVSNINIQRWAGGGGGAGPYSSSGSSGGGGGGYVGDSATLVDPGQLIYFNIGAGGAGGTQTGSAVSFALNGKEGGATSMYGSVAFGGGGGIMTVNGTNESYAGGAGGLASGGFVTTSGQNGDPAVSSAAIGKKGGDAGNTAGGGGTGGAAKTGSGTYNQDGNPGNAPGGGGGGSQIRLSGTRVGGQGGNGGVKFSW